MLPPRSFRQVSKSGPDSVHLAGLTSQLALRIPYLSLPRVELQAGCHPARHLCEFWGSELCAQYYCVWKLLLVTLIQGDSWDTPSPKYCKVWGQTLSEEQSQLNGCREPGGTCPGLSSYKGQATAFSQVNMPL